MFQLSGMTIFFCQLDERFVSEWCVLTVVMCKWNEYSNLCNLLDQPRRQTEPNQTGLKKWQSTVRWQLLSPPWIHLELWSFSTGEKPQYYYMLLHNCQKALSCWVDKWAKTDKFFNTATSYSWNVIVNSSTFLLPKAWTFCLLPIHLSILSLIYCSAYTFSVWSCFSC